MSQAFAKQPSMPECEHLMDAEFENEPQFERFQSHFMASPLQTVRRFNLGIQIDTVTFMLFSFDRTQSAHNILQSDGQADFYTSLKTQFGIITNIYPVFERSCEPSAGVHIWSLAGQIFG